MTTIKTQLTGMLLIYGLLLPMCSQAWEPNAKARDAALEEGDVATYFAKLTTWLDQQVPSAADKISEESILPLLDDPVFTSAMAERRFLKRLGVNNCDAQLKSDPKSKAFLSWLLSNGALLNETLIAQTPSAWHWRNDDSQFINGHHLSSWKDIYTTDSTSRKGLYAKLAAACFVRPPGTGTRGAGNAKEHSSIVDRYNHFRRAHATGELMPSFEDLTIWELSHVVSSGASNADLAWGREALNTWKPGFRKNENVVAMTSQVWYRGSQVPYTDFSCVAAGGGKCGPRSSFGVFINQAFGVPAIGVGQPAHAAIGYRNTEGDWQVGYGRGWHVSKLLQMPGPAFVEVVKDRQSGKFDKIEHLRWLAALIESPGVEAYVVPDYIMSRTGVRGVVPEDRYENARARAVYFTYRSLPPSFPKFGKIKRTPFASGNPDEVTTLTTFQAPAGVGEYYFTRVRGYVYPPQSGEYQFSITSDDDSDLYLSTDDQAENKVCVTLVKGWSDPNDFSRKSKPVRLVAGQKYYIEAVHRELDGGDHLTVGWSGPELPQAVIPGENLSPFGSDKRGSILREVWTGPMAAEAKPASERTKPESPIKVAPGVIHVEAEKFFSSSRVNVEDCYTGGKQVYYPSHTDVAFCGYKIKVPKAGKYEFKARVATINWGQQMYVRSFGAMHPVKFATASDVYRNQQDVHGPQLAIDHDLGSRWAMNFGKDQGWIELDLGQPREISKMIIDERSLGRVSKYKVEYKAGVDWKLLFEGDNFRHHFVDDGTIYTHILKKEFPKVTAQHVRLSTMDTDNQTGGPTIWDFSVGDVFDGSGFVGIPWAPASEKGKKDGISGLWQTSPPLELTLAEGEQNIFVCAQTIPGQRSFAMRWFQLTPTSRLKEKL